MSKILSLQDKIALASKYDLEANVLLSVIAVEASGSGFNQDGTIKIQFEPYWFRHYTGIKIPNGVEGQTEEYRAFNTATDKDPEAAMLSTSWGIGMIMGFNFKSAGYKNVEEMVIAFKESEYNQLEGMLKHIQSKPSMYNALKVKDWTTFAYYYNGKEYKKYNYDNRLKAAYDKLKN